MTEWITHPLLLIPLTVIGVPATGWATLLFINYLLKDKRFDAASDRITRQVDRLQRERNLTTADTGLMPVITDSGRPDQTPDLDRPSGGRHHDTTAGSGATHSPARRPIHPSAPPVPRRIAAS